MAFGFGTYEKRMQKAFMQIPKDVRKGTSYVNPHSNMLFVDIFNQVIISAKTLDSPKSENAKDSIKKNMQADIMAFEAYAQLIKQSEELQITESKSVGLRDLSVEFRDYVVLIEMAYKEYIKLFQELDLDVETLRDELKKTDDSFISFVHKLYEAHHNQ